MLARFMNIHRPVDLHRRNVRADRFGHPAMNRALIGRWSMMPLFAFPLVIITSSSSG